MVSVSSYVGLTLSLAFLHCSPGVLKAEMLQGGGSEKRLKELLTEVESQFSDVALPRLSGKVRIFNCHSMSMLTRRYIMIGQIRSIQFCSAPILKSKNIQISICERNEIVSIKQYNDVRNFYGEEFLRKECS